MSADPWGALAGFAEPAPVSGWLPGVLARNAGCAYLRAHGAPAGLEAFRASVPIVDYAELAPWIARLAAGEADVLFAGRPVAYERTGGSSGGSKLIPYSAEGLADFSGEILPWLARTVRDYRIAGRAYFSISPATRAPESIGDLPLGLPDAAYLGETGGRVLLERSAVPPAVAALADVETWLAATLAALRAAPDLELISVWSPTFLLRLLDELGDATRYWPRLKLVSCWASGPARRYAQELQARLPQARIQPKGLLATEGVVTVPDALGRPLLAWRGFYEFLDGGRVLLAEELLAEQVAEVVMTTASGLYRYRTGDFVRCTGHDAAGRPWLEFLGRGGLVSDLVGEKLDEGFVARCLEELAGYALLVADVARPGYVLVSERPLAAETLKNVETALEANPQYAYARRLGQLTPLRGLCRPDAAARVERVMLGRGVRLGDIKPLALRGEAFWLPLMEEEIP